MNLPNEDQWDETNCSSAVCQHPQCWASLRRIERGHPRILDSPGRYFRETDDKLPTLTIVNIMDTCLGTKKRVAQRQSPEFTFPKEQERSLLLKPAFRRHSRSQKALHDKGVTSCSRPPKLSVLDLNEAKLPFSEDIRNMVVTWVPEETEENMSSVGKTSAFFQQAWGEEEKETGRGKKYLKRGQKEAVAIKGDFCQSEANSQCDGIVFQWIRSYYDLGLQPKPAFLKSQPSLHFSGRQYTSTNSRSLGVIVPPPSPVHLFDQLSSEAIPLLAQVNMLSPGLLKECILAHEKTMTCPEVKIKLAKMKKNLPLEKTCPDSAVSSKMYLTVHRLTLQRPSLRYPEHLRKLQYNLKRAEGSSGLGPSGYKKQQKQQPRKVKTSTIEQEAKKKVKSDVESKHSQRIPSRQESEQKQKEQEEEGKKASMKCVSIDGSVASDLDACTDNSTSPESPVIYKDMSDVHETMLGMLPSSQDSSPRSMSRSADRIGWNPELKLLRILQATVEEDEENHLSRAQSEASLDA